MDLTLSQLSVLQIIVFLTVVEKKGITKAADELHMTQPAVSQSIFSLEKKLELQLFHHAKRTFELTKNGEHLYEEWKPHMEGLQKAYYRVLRDETKRVRQVSVAVTTTIDCYDYMTRCIARFHEKYPGTEVFFCRDALPNQRAMFYKGKYDVIVLPKILEAAVLKWDYPYKRIAQSQHVAIMSRNHPLAGRESLAAEDLRECVFIGIDSPDMPLYRNVEKLKSILKCTEEPTIIKTVLSPDAISSMYEMGQGVFIGDHYMDVTRMKNICCIPIRDAYANLVCVWNDQSPAAVRFVSFLKD